jgi:cellulose synthase/poly-beta-1,6-N-acetylglucosamine synthase-like glycosyltransferase
MKKIAFSIIIPVRNTTPYLKETLKRINKQTYKNYELLVITDKVSFASGASVNQLGPSYKRNLGAKQAKGKYLAFLDDDSYPNRNWLRNALTVFKDNRKASAICGPCLTPPKDNIKQQASGLVWSSRIGSGGAGVYRNSISKKRLVDDYPTVNLIVKKSDFEKVGGFNNHYWPGEDTILCLELTRKLKKTIIYHPSIVVYHHRRNVFIPHLQQITRYAIHRGYFAKKFPETSFRIGYFIPSIFVFYLVSFLFLSLNYLIYRKQTDPFLLIYSIPILIYIFAIIFSFVYFIIKRNNFKSSLLAIIAIPITHIYYGILFLFGLFKFNLNFKPHKVDPKTGKYIGG